MRTGCNRPIRIAVAVLLLATLAVVTATAQPGRPGFPPARPRVELPNATEYARTQVGDRIPIAVNGNRAGRSGSWVDVLPNNGSRLWMDSAGKHTIEAVLASQAESSVSLQRQDGSKTSLPINRLSIADQRFLEKPKEQEEEAAPNRSSIPSTIRPFLSVQMERLSSNSSGRGQTVAGSPSESTAWKSVGFSIGDDAEFLPLDRDGCLVLVTARASGPGADDGSPYQSVVCNVETNNVVARVHWPGEVKVLDYDAAYDHLLVGAAS